MRTFIHSFFILATAASLILAGAGCSKQARKDSHLRQADRYFTAGAYDRAEIEYLNVLQIEALNPRAIGRLGLIYFDQGRIGRANAYLLRGRELQPDNLELRVKVGHIHLATGKRKEAREEAEFVLERRPDDEEAPLMLVESAAKAEELAEIRQRLQQLPPPASDGAPVLIALGLIELRLRNADGAEQTLQRALAANPKSDSVHMALGLLHLVQNNRPQAEQDFKQAAELSPPRSPKRLQYAQFKIRAGDLASGKQLLKEMSARTPDFLPAWVWLAEIALVEKDFDECSTLLARALTRDSVHPEAMLLSARLRSAKGEHDKAVAELEQMLRVYPKAPQIHYHLGLAHVARGDVAKAVNSLNQSLNLAPGNADAIVLLASLNLRQGDASSAIVALRQLVEQRPDIPQARLLLADAYRARGSLDDALAIYRQFEKDSPGSPQIALLTGTVLLQQKKREEARQAFNLALERSPDLFAAVEQLVNIDLAERHYAAARLRVDGLIAKNPDKAAPHLLLSRVHYAQKEADEAEAALRKAIELEPESPAAYFMLAGLYIETGQQERALASLQEAVAKNPKDTSAMMLIGMINDRMKNHEAARDAYEKVLAINPRSGVALNNLAYLYSEKFNQLDKAFETAQKAREVMPHEAHTADTLGWILFKRGQYPWALSLLQESSDKLPDMAEVQYHLGLVHYMMGSEEPARQALQRALKAGGEFPGADDARRRQALLELDIPTAGADARALLEKTLADRPDDPIALIRMAAIHERDGDSAKAMAIYEQAVRTGSSNAGAMVKLAQLHAARNETAKALDLARSARKVAPDDPVVAHVLGRLAFQTGDYIWANSLLQESARRLPENGAVLFDLANASYSVGRAADAENAMRGALRVELPATQAAEARRFLEMTGLANDPAKASAAAERVGQILKSEPGYIPALMASAAISAQRSDTAAVRQAYEKALTVFPEFGPARRALVILLAGDAKDNQRAVELAPKAREAYPNDAELAKAYGIALYHNGDFARAANLLQEASRQRADDAGLWYHLGMARHRLNRAAESREALERALEIGLAGEQAAEAKKILAESESR